VRATLLPLSQHAPDASCICAQHRVHPLTLRSQSSRSIGRGLMTITSPPCALCL
jgi:hypothetical protein